MSLIHYIIVRKDLPLGVLAAMVAHGAGESGSLYGNAERLVLPHDTTAVVLQVDNELELFKAEKHLRDNYVMHVEIVESGGTYANQLMAIGLVPGERDKLSPLMKDFKLLEAEPSDLRIDNDGTYIYSPQIPYDKVKLEVAQESPDMDLQMCVGCYQPVHMCPCP